MFEEGLPENTLDGCYVGGMYVKERQVYPWQRIGFPNYSNTRGDTDREVKASWNLTKRISYDY